MKRYVAIIAVLLFLLAGTVVLLFVLHPQPTETQYRLARGRAQLDTENYLAALQTLRNIPDSKRSGADTHSYIGAAYLKLHLYRAAINEFEQAIKDRPRESDPWIGLASSYFELGDSQKAIEQAMRATEIEKRSVEAWIALGRAEWQQKNWDEAEKAALKARELEANNTAATDLLLHVYFDLNQDTRFRSELDRTTKPSRPIRDLAVRFFMRRGQFAHANDLKTRFEREDLDRSILDTQLALQREPSNTELYPQLVKNLVKAGRFDEAVNTAARYKGSAALDLELGKAYWTLGRTEDAVQAFRRASAGLIHKLSSEVALAVITGDIKHWKEAYRAERVEQDYFILSRLEEQIAKADPLVRSFIFRYAGIYDASFYNKAAEEALKVLDEDPKNFDAMMTISTAYQRIGRIDDAYRYVQQAKDLYPNSGEPAMRLANLTLMKPQKDPENVLALMELAVKLEPNNAGYLYNLGWAYDQLGENAKATGLYQRAIKASPLTFEAMNNLALIYSNSGQPDRALPLLEQAMRTDPDNEAVYANAGNYYAHRRDWKKALENYDRALQIDPGSSVAAVEKGRIYLELGETDDAVENLSRALEIDAHSFDAYMLLSAAYEKMGHIREAIAAAEEAKRIRSDSPEVKATLDRLNTQHKD